VTGEAEVNAKPSLPSLIPLSISQPPKPNSQFSNSNSPSLLPSALTLSHKTHIQAREKDRKSAPPPSLLPPSLSPQQPSPTMTASNSSSSQQQREKPAWRPRSRQRRLSQPITINELESEYDRSERECGILSASTSQALLIAKEGDELNYGENNEENGNSRPMTGSDRFLEDKKEKMDKKRERRESRGSDEKDGKEKSSKSQNRTRSKSVERSEGSASASSKNTGNSIVKRSRKSPSKRTAKEGEPEQESCLEETEYGDDGVDGDSKSDDRGRDRKRLSDQPIVIELPTEGLLKSKGRVLAPKGEEERERYHLKKEKLLGRIAKLQEENEAANLLREGAVQQLDIIKKESESKLKEGRKINDLERKFGQLKEDFAKKSGENEELSQKITNLKKDNEKSENALVKELEQLKRDTIEKQELSQQLLTLKNDSEMRERELNLLIGQLRSELETKQSEIVKFSQRLGDFQRESVKKENETNLAIEKLRSEIDANENEKEIVKLKDENVAHVEQLRLEMKQELEVRNRELEESLRQVEILSRESKVSHDDARSKIEKLEIELKEKEEMIQELLNRYEVLKIENGNREKESLMNFEQLKQDVASANREKELVSKQLTELMRENVLNEARQKELLEQMTGLQEEESERKNELLQQLADLRSESAKREIEANSKIENMRSELEKREIELQKGVDKLKHELEKKTVENEEILQQLKNQKLDNELIATEFERQEKEFEARIEQQLNEIESVKSQSAAIANEKEQLLLQLSNLVVEKEKVRTELGVELERLKNENVSKFEQLEQDIGLRILEKEESLRQVADLKKQLEVAQNESLARMEKLLTELKSKEELIQQLSLLQGQNEGKEKEVQIALEQLKNEVETLSSEKNAFLQDLSQLKSGNELREMEYAAEREKLREEFAAKEKEIVDKLSLEGQTNSKEKEELVRELEKWKAMKETVEQELEKSKIENGNREKESLMNFEQLKQDVANVNREKELVSKQLIELMRENVLNEARQKELLDREIEANSKIEKMRSELENREIESREGVDKLKHELETKTVVDKLNNEIVWLKNERAIREQERGETDSNKMEMQSEEEKVTQRTLAYESNRDFETRSEMEYLSQQLNDLKREYVKREYEASSRIEYLENEIATRGIEKLGGKLGLDIGILKNENVIQIDQLKQDLELRNVENENLARCLSDLEKEFGLKDKESQVLITRLVEEAEELSQQILKLTMVTNHTGNKVGLGNSSASFNGEEMAGKVLDGRAENVELRYNYDLIFREKAELTQLLSDLKIESKKKECEVNAVTVSLNRANERLEEELAILNSNYQSLVAEKELVLLQLTQAQANLGALVPVNMHGNAMTSFHPSEATSSLSPIRCALIGGLVLGSLGLWYKFKSNDNQ
jgi:hypothetical protein